MTKLLKKIVNRMVALAVGLLVAVGLFLAHRFWGLLGMIAVIIAWWWAGKSGIKIFDEED